MSNTSFSPNRGVRNNTMGGKLSAAIKAIDVTRMLEKRGWTRTENGPEQKPKARQFGTPLALTAHLPEHIRNVGEATLLAADRENWDNIFKENRTEIILQAFIITSASGFLEVCFSRSEKLRKQKNKQKRKTHSLDFASKNEGEIRECRRFNARAESIWRNRTRDVDRSTYQPALAPEARIIPLNQFPTTETDERK